MDEREILLLTVIEGAPPIFVYADDVRAIEADVQTARNVYLRLNAENGVYERIAPARVLPQPV